MIRSDVIWLATEPMYIRAGADRRAAAIMSLIQSPRNNGHDSDTYLKDFLMRLPTQRAC